MLLHKNLRGILAASALFMSVNAFATPPAPMRARALPPFYQTRNEIETVLKSQELQDRLGSGRPILTISRVKNSGDGVEGYMVLTTNDCAVFARRVLLPRTSTIAGPVQFTFEYGSLSCPQSSGSSTSPAPASN